MKLVSYAMVVAFLFVGASCDSGGGGGKNYDEPLEAGSTQKEAAKGSIDSVTSLKTLAEQNAGDDAAVGKVTGAFGNLNVLVSAKQQAEMSDGGLPSGYTGATGGLAAVQAALDAACYQQSGASVTYNACNYGGGTIDGTVTMDGENLSMDLHITSTVAGNMDMTETGQLTMSATQVTGELSMAVDMDMAGMPTAGGADYRIHYEVDATYAVTLTDGCPTGGNLEVHAITSVEGGGLPAGVGEYDVWVRADFGPACGDVTLY